MEIQSLIIELFEKVAFTIDAHGVDVLLIATIAHKIGAINYILLFNDLERVQSAFAQTALAGIISDYQLECEVL